MGEQYNPEGNDNAKFNMAIDTLRRIGSIFEQIKNLYLDQNMPRERRQAIKIDLIKQFFVQASPLLGEDTVELFKDKVLSLSSKTMKTYQRKNGGSSEYVGQSLQYNDELDIKIDTILIELQQNCVLHPSFV